MKNLLLELMIILGIVFFTTACATKRPVLYPNEQLREVGANTAQHDIDECIQLAAEAGLTSKSGEKIASQAATGAAVGAAVGTAVGAVNGRTGRGAAAGAAGGGTAGFMRGLFGSRNPDPIQQRFIEECLRERRYKVIGWR